MEKSTTVQIKGINGTDSWKRLFLPWLLNLFQFLFLFSRNELIHFRFHAFRWDFILLFILQRQHSALKSICATDFLFNPYKPWASWLLSWQQQWMVMFLRDIWKMGSLSGRGKPKEFLISTGVGRKRFLWKENVRPSCRVVLGKMLYFSG